MHKYFTLYKLAPVGLTLREHVCVYVCVNMRLAELENENVYLIDKW